MMKPIQYAPSLFCMDLLHAGQQIAFLNCNADRYHIDIMDAHFVDNLALSPLFVESVAAKSVLPIDCHLMVTDPDRYIGRLARAGAACIEFHVESLPADSIRIIDAIHVAGCEAGLAISPSTPFDQAIPYLQKLEKLLIMTIEPGYSGARFLPEMIEKIEAADTYRREHSLNYLIEIDGSCGDDNIVPLVEAGADIIVVGTPALFGRDANIETAWKRMQTSFEQLLQFQFPEERLND